MNEESLRKLIREEIEHALDEVDAYSKKAPQTFNEFRKALGAVMKQADAPIDMVDEVMDVNNVGGGVPQCLASDWESLKYELDDIATNGGEFVDADQLDAFAGSAYDAVLNVYGSAQNAWNYAPGHKREKADAHALAEKVEGLLLKSVTHVLPGSPVMTDEF